MSNINNSRTTDLGNILTEGTTGFTVRKRTGIGLFFHFFLLACMVLMGAALLVYYQSPRGCALAVFIGLSFALVALNLEKHKKLKESLEFMNALFSSALGSGYAFCFIVKFTGDIVFYNRPFQAVFPAYLHQDTRTLDSLTNLYAVPQEQRDQLDALMKAKRSGELTLDVRGSGAEVRPLKVEVTSIERPTGFFLVRGN